MECVSNASLMIVSGSTMFARLGARADEAIACAAFLGAMTVTVLVYRLGSSQGRVQLSVLLLSGIAANALAGAIIGMLSYVTLASLVSLRPTACGSHAVPTSDASCPPRPCLAPFSRYSPISLRALLQRPRPTVHGHCEFDVVPDIKKDPGSCPPGSFADS
jgi:hypothetical protein